MSSPQQSQRTPTPWIARAPHETSGQAVIEVIRDGIRSKIAVLIPSHLCDEHGGDVASNAAFIVTACNAYEANQRTIAELTEAIKYAIAILDQPISRRLKADDSIFRYDIASAESIMRAAISKAKEASK